MSKEHGRSEKRESVFLLETVRRSSGEQTVKVRTISEGGALVQGLTDAAAGQAAQIGIRGLSWVDRKVAWNPYKRTGLSISTRLDLSVVGQMIRQQRQMSIPV